MVFLEPGDLRADVDEVGKIDKQITAGGRRGGGAGSPGGIRADDSQACSGH